MDRLDLLKIKFALEDSNTLLNVLKEVVKSEIFLGNIAETISGNDKQIKKLQNELDRN